MVRESDLWPLRVGCGRHKTGLGKRVRKRGAEQAQARGEIALGAAGCRKGRCRRSASGTDAALHMDPFLWWCWDRAPATCGHPKTSDLVHGGRFWGPLPNLKLRSHYCSTTHPPRPPKLSSPVPYCQLFPKFLLLINYLEFSFGGKAHLTSELPLELF